MALESEHAFFNLANAHQSSDAAARWEPSPATLSTESDEYQIIFELAGCGMAQADPATLRLTRVNRRLCGWLGYAPEEMAGGDIRRFIHPEDRAQAECDLERLIRGELPEYVSERRYLRKSGEPLWVEVSVTLLRDAAGRPQRVVTVFHDITERKQVESALRSVALFPEQNPAPVVRATPEGRLIYLNPPARAMLARLGWREGEILPEALRNVLAAALRGDAMCEHEFFDGERFMLVQCLPVGAEGYVNLYAHDMTERRRAEEALRASEAHAQRRLAEILSIYDTAPVGLCIFDPELRYVRINERLAEINGIPPREHLGRTLREILPTLADQVEPVFRRILETGEPVLGVELIGETAAHPGVTHIWNENYSPLRDAAERVVGISVVVEDITERRQVEMELKRVAEELREADRRKDEYLAMLAHELRNPLAPINNAVQVLKLAGDDMGLCGRQWEIIERQVAHMARLLDDLLDVARVTRGKIELRREPLALGEALSRAVELTLPGIESLRHKLEFQPPPEGLRVEGDLDRLIQVIGNLLGNAAKFTPPGGRLRLSAAKEDGMAVIRVRDSGIGIHPEMLPRIFELFTQVQSSTSRLQGGLGIGLTMARSLAQMHGGAIEVQSAGLGQGSEFIVRLPALPPATLEPSGVAASPRKEPAKRAKAPRRVLIVDDAADAADSLSELLSRWGHQVRISHNGPEALALAGEFDPEFVLLDIGLPDMDGYEIARRLRQNRPDANMTLVAVTGYGQASDRERTRDAGFDHHMVKPVDLRSLRELLAGQSPA